MATNVRSAVANRLGKSGTLSLKRDVFGVYGNDNPQSRSLISQMELIETKPFVRVALVTVTDNGASPPAIPNPLIQRDLDNANTIYKTECGAWIYCEGSITLDRPNLAKPLDQDDCSLSNHSVSDDEDALFDLGRDMGANIVCYYISSNTIGAGGCAAHPPGRRGFWVGRNPKSPLVAFAHELTHVVGDNEHVTTAGNLMTQAPNKPVSSTLTPDQCARILADPDMDHP